MTMCTAGRYLGTCHVWPAWDVSAAAVESAMRSAEGLSRRAGERLTVTMPWRVSPEAVRPTVARQEHRLAPYVNAVALCVLLLALSVGVQRIVVRRRGRRQLDTDSPAPAEMLVEDVR
jgi:flagellar biosynthesis/type III secretory pathway M-ring protein FliF/YscJ